MKGLATKFLFEVNKWFHSKAMITLFTYKILYNLPAFWQKLTKGHF